MVCARKAYEDNGPERAKLLAQIKALLPLIEHLKGDISFTSLFDALNGPTLNYSGSCSPKAKWAREIRHEARTRDIVIDEWEQLTTVPAPGKNANEGLRQFIQDHKEVLGGYFAGINSGKRTRYKWIRL